MRIISCSYRTQLPEDNRGGQERVPKPQVRVDGYSSHEISRAQDGEHTHSRMLE